MRDPQINTTLICKDSNGKECKYGLKIWRNAGQVVVLLTEMSCNPGMSITNNIERAVKAVIERTPVYSNAIFVEYYPSPDRYDIVRFGRWDARGPHNPHWERISKDWFEKLVEHVFLEPTITPSVFAPGISPVSTEVDSKHTIATLIAERGMLAEGVLCAHRHDGGDLLLMMPKFVDALDIAKRIVNKPSAVTPPGHNATPLADGDPPEPPWLPGPAPPRKPKT